MMTQITLVAGCWAVNMGNAFIDLGSRECLRQACQPMEIKITSSFPIWLFDSKGQRRGKLFKNVRLNYFSLIKHVDSDFVVFSGMVLSEGFITRYRDQIVRLRKKGVRLIINGGGGRTYSDEEITKYREFLKEVKPYCFVSRDERSFEYYKDLAEYSYCGIDCAFFINDYFRPWTLGLGEFDVHTFDTLIDPVVPEDAIKIIRTHHSVIRLKKAYFHEADTLISDQPTDYLNLYGNCRVVHSDRVHACIAALAYGKRCKLHSDTVRAMLFKRVGIDINSITQSTVSVEDDVVSKVKQEQVEFLSRVFNEK